MDGLDDPENYNRIYIGDKEYLGGSDKVRGRTLLTLTVTFHIKSPIGLIMIILCIPNQLLF